MPSIVDVSTACGNKAAALFATGVRTIIRYYSRDTVRPSKRLTLEESEQLAAVGLRLGIVHEGRFGDQASNFDRASGVADALYSRTYGAEIIRQPRGSAIYFAVDFDVTPDIIKKRIIPYFQAVADTFAGAAGSADYVIGVYGSGVTCKAVLDAGLAQRAWLSQSVGWSGYAAFLKSGRWALSQAMPTTIAGVECDPNKSGEAADIGDFALIIGELAGHEHDSRQMRVNARGGLRLRAGPGTDFDSLRLLPLGTPVFALKTVGSWTMVDVEGDGVADGFVSGAFLSDSSVDSSELLGGSRVLASAHLTGDTPHLLELIRQGSTADGLKAARESAAASLPDYPHNGCAAHLSALLQHSNIDVPMTWGAGKLAHVLGDRGWIRIPVGRQQVGDVGVCFDNDPTAAGADHIYLVVKTVGLDEMLIADNQRTADAPHVGYASGHGKTPTEYFLRAI